MTLQLFSVDDHLLEPPDLWTSRLPAKYHDTCFRLERVDGVNSGARGRAVPHLEDVRQCGNPVRSVGPEHDQLRRDAAGLL